MEVFSFLLLYLFICFRLSARGLRTALRKAVFCVVKDEGVSKSTPSFLYDKVPTFTSWGFVIT